MKLFNLFGTRTVNRPAEVLSGVTVEEIHAAVDAQEDEFLKMINGIINSTNDSIVSIEKREQNKNKLLNQFGFINSELSQNLNERVDNNEKLKKKSEVLTKTLDLFNEYKKAYPFEKIIPFEIFNKVMEKYKLIYAPTTAYIKDVPEKNLKELQSVKKTQRDHYMKPLYYISEVTVDRSFWRSSETVIKLQKDIANIIDNDKSLKFLASLKSITTTKYYLEVYDDYDIELYFSPRKQQLGYGYYNELKTILSAMYHNNYLDKIHYTGNDVFNYCRANNIPTPIAISHESQLSKYVNVCAESNTTIEEDRKEHLRLINDAISKLSDSSNTLSSTNIKYSKLDRDKLFISAPKSHFDLSKLTQANENGFYEGVVATKVNVKVEVKDPIVFEFLQGNEKYPEGFVRILTKWGTDDDQSYMDPEVQNENLN